MLPSAFANASSSSSIMSSTGAVRNIARYECKGCVKEAPWKLVLRLVSWSLQQDWRAQPWGPESSRYSPFVSMRRPSRQKWALWCSGRSILNRMLGWSRWDVQWWDPLPYHEHDLWRHAVYSASSVGNLQSGWACLGSPSSPGQGGPRDLCTAPEAHRNRYKKPPPPVTRWRHSANRFCPPHRPGFASRQSPCRQRARGQNCPGKFSYTWTALAVETPTKVTRNAATPADGWNLPKDPSRDPLCSPASTRHFRVFEVVAFFDGYPSRLRGPIDAG